MDSLIVYFLFRVVFYTGLGYTIFSILQSMGAKKWPRVQGKVIWAGIDESYDGYGRSYNPVVEYAYELRGKEYISKRIGFDLLGSRFKLMSNYILNQFPIESEVDVFYFHRDFNKSVLLTGVRIFHIAQVIVFGTCLVIFECNV